ncbi:hypothetical protein AXK58_06020 [Tsukamurella tyrosinosolvens]|uniref:GIY-YIG domain-containing protein n=1 Tax=Tsukamurella tyrosinosolvens TaxID=57704 RepID=A0A1H4ME73_TSUTY|nr:GIY-YIG nuclease family protein [Tsukamurella tyrosinosolvens]KXO96829.1 hypothetical protein AXK58_06020 [Tsukamurella tyrosinosolvens]SEB80835.1 hypothetical protein SAMN04489793_0826 [Tsukamurella tyrosinosolvens]
MSIRAAVDQWADAEGFRPAVQFEGSKSEIGGKPGARYSGFYLLIFTNDTYYLGESVDLRSRMGGHMRHWGDEVAEVRFLRKTLSKPQLRAAERGLIYRLNRVVPKQCRNTTHASYTSHKNELIDLLDDEEQAAWVSDAASFNENDPSPLKPIAVQQSMKYHTAAKRFRSRPDHTRIVSTLRTYLETCIPAPRRTEFHGWNVSTGASGGDRLLCVSVGRMETFVVFKDNHGFINVPAESAGITERRRLTQLHPDVLRVDIRGYDDFGDVAIIRATSLAAVDALLADDAVRRGAQTLAYSVMRKHPSVYTRYHCPQVVEDVYQARGFTRPAAAEDDSPIGPDESVAEENATAQPLPSEPAPELVESVPDDIEIDWFVNAGPVSSRRNMPEEFRANGEWRMDPDPKYEHKVQEMLAGERIAVRRRRNVSEGVPFDARGNLVSAMDILMTGTVVSNPGDGVSVRVRWDSPMPPRRWYLYTSQDTVWSVPRGVGRHLDSLSAFTFDGAAQDVDYWRNLPFWTARFGD